MVLDPVKLEFLNKHHLMRAWSSPAGLKALSERVQDLVKEAFPTRWVGATVLWVSSPSC